MKLESHRWCAAGDASPACAMRCSYHAVGRWWRHGTQALHGKWACLLNANPAMDHGPSHSREHTHTQKKRNSVWVQQWNHNTHLVSEIAWMRIFYNNTHLMSIIRSFGALQKYWKRIVSLLHTAIQWHAYHRQAKAPLSLQYVVHLLISGKWIVHSGEHCGILGLRVCIVGQGAPPSYPFGPWGHWLTGWCGLRGSCGLACPVWPAQLRNFRV